MEYEVAAEGEGKAPVVRTVIPVERIDATQKVVGGKSTENNPGFWFLVFDNS